ncbi:hypothetical protein V3C99_011207 [Haemonchus contortus]
MLHNDIDHTNGPQLSRANVGVSQISVPLAWHGDQHFKSKGETCVYSMFAVLQTKSRAVDSRMVTNVDRTMTDVVFPESFIFEGEPDDFCIEITLYAARTDLGLYHGGGGLRTRITRSLGRRFGGQVKSSLSAMDPPNMPGEPTIGGTHFNMLARAYLVLTDASDECKIHDLKMSAFADLSGPPLYGNLLCRLAVQPHSVLRPLAEGVLSIEPLRGGRILRNVRSRLQAGSLHCFMNTDIRQNSLGERTLLLVPITSKSRIMTTTHLNTLVLLSNNTADVRGHDFYLTTENQKTMLAWKKAFEMQIDDCAIWGNFAYRPTKLTSEEPADPVKETLSRAGGNRLYDKISIEGSVSRNCAILSPYLSYCPRDLSPLKTAANTAPTKRHRHRGNVLELFEKPKPTRQPTPEVTPRSLFMSSSNGDVHKCIINVSQDNDYGYEQIRSESSSYMPWTTSKPLAYSSHMPMPSPKNHENVPNYEMLVDITKGKSGKKSWSTQMGGLLGKKIQSYPIEVTRL